MIQFSFILVEPGEPGNIGAAARAINTMGYSDLRLVRPQTDPLSETARVLAHGSQHILETAQTFDTLTEALNGIDLACASTARHRLQKHHYISVRDLPEVLHNKGEGLKQVAIVFGSERSGLKAKDIELCDLVTTIPQGNLQPSLNLAQAVMIYSFMLSSDQTSIQIQDQRLQQAEMPTPEYASLKTLTLKLMNRLGLEERYQTYIIKGLGRLDCADLYLLHNIRSLIDRKLDQCEGQQQADE